MNHSIFWARLIGFYAVILSSWCFVDIKNIHTVLADFSSNHSFSMTLGIFTVFIGLAMVVSHSIWRGWPILVTIVGYWITVKGIVLLFFPHFIHQIITYWNGKNLYFAPIPAMVIGLILLYCSFFLKKKA